MVSWNCNRPTRQALPRRHIRCSPDAYDALAMTESASTRPASKESAATAPTVPRGRWAPTPSGQLHVGNARSALLAWLSIRSRGGSFLWRLEDLDPPRALAGAAEQALDDLAWLGLDWDEGPDIGGPHGPYEQSRRGDFYDRALMRLAGDGRLFPCRLSRKDLRNLATAPHGPAAAVYPASLRPTDLPADWHRPFFEPDQRPDQRPDAALRFKVDDRPVRYVDGLHGARVERVDETVGDFVLKRRDGLYAYQLAVVVDDLAMGVTEVVRGVDLLDSTARQIQLIEALGGQSPQWIHVPLIVDPRGEKLSKRHQSLTLAALRETGVRAPDLIGYLAWSAGLLDEARPVSPRELVDDFCWRRVRLETFFLRENLAQRLAGGTRIR